jgi:Tfp pilus assembly protein PilF
VVNERTEAFFDGTTPESFPLRAGQMGKLSHEKGTNPKEIVFRLGEFVSNVDAHQPQDNPVCATIANRFSFQPFSSMRRLVALLLATFAALYSSAAVFFYVQEIWAREPERVTVEDDGRLLHPEAPIGVVRSRFDRYRYTEEELALVRRSLLEAPAFYQAPFLLATYHANRLESPETTRAAFEAAIRRYPANGRLHLAFGTWLLQSRTSIEGWIDPEQPNRLRDPLPVAESHLRSAMALEPDLAWTALRALDDYHIPPARWAALVPDDDLARRHLVDVLITGGHPEEGNALLRNELSKSDDPAVLRQLTLRGLEGGDPELTLAAATKWQEAVERTKGIGPALFEPTLYIARAHRAAGDTEAAYQSMQDVLDRLEARLGRDSRVTLDFLCAMATEYLSVGQTLTAESMFGEVLSRSPSHVPALLGLARALARAGDPDAAIDRYREVLAFEPHHPEADRELRRLLVATSR